MRKQGNPVSSLLPTSESFEDRAGKRGAERRGRATPALLALCLAATAALVATRIGRSVALPDSVSEVRAASEVGETEILFDGDERTLHEDASSLNENETAVATDETGFLSEKMTFDVNLSTGTQENEAEPTNEIAVVGSVDGTINETASVAETTHPKTKSNGTGKGDVVPVVTNLDEGTDAVEETIISAYDDVDTAEEILSQDNRSESNDNRSSRTVPTPDIGEETLDQGDNLTRSNETSVIETSPTPGMKRSLVNSRDVSEKGVAVLEEETKAEKPSLFSEVAGASAEEPETFCQRRKIKTVVRVISSLTLGNVDIPHISHERETLVASIEESVASALLSNGAVLVKRADVFCFGGRPLSGSRPCLRRTQQSRRRARQTSSTHVEFEATVAMVGEANDEGSAVGPSGAPEVQAALRASGTGTLRGAVVEGYSLLDSEGRCAAVSFPFLPSLPAPI